MKTKLRSSFLALFCMGALASIGQDDDMPAVSGDRLKEIKAQKVAYITSKINLTSEEAQRFWPIYNEFDESREKLRAELRDLHKSNKGTELTEAQAKETLAKGLDVRTRELELERTYSDRFVKSIGAVKTVDLVKAEREFQREVLRRFRERMQEQRGAGGPGGRPGGRR
ncbi:MAG TPA: hypothetical protein PK760_12595 [Flavobacteriales bacterium]|nr:hypothetical protein [Flavobacteriales bacterium]